MYGEDVGDADGGGSVVMNDGSFVTVDCIVPREVSSMTFNFVGSEGKLYVNNNDGEWATGRWRTAATSSSRCPALMGRGRGGMTTSAPLPTPPIISSTCLTERRKTTRRAGR